MAFGLGVLRLPPAAFWTMTLPELAAAMRPLAGETDGFGQAQLDALMQAYPDARDGAARSS